MRLGPALLLVASLVGSGCTTQPAPTLAAVRSGTSRPTASASRPLWTPYATPTLTPFGYRVMPAEGEVWSVTTDGASIAWIETAPLREDGVARRRFVGAASSEVLYRARPGTILQDLVVAGDHFAVVEVTAHPDDAGQFSWRLLYGAAPGATPVVLAGEERSVTRLGVVPEMAMDDRRLVLTVQHGDLEADVWTNELLEIDLQSMSRRRLASANFHVTEYWYPSLDGSRLVFSTVEYAQDPVNGARHVYLQDLAQPWAPRRLDRDGNASFPVIRGDSVIWKVSDRDFNVRNWGQLHAYSLASRTLRALDFAPLAGSDSHRDPSIGNRFVGAELADTSRLSVFDLQTWSELPLEVYARDTTNTLMQVRVAGDLAVWLLAYDRHDGEGRDVEIHYAELPPPG
jgi:hypothetical protein